MPGPREFKTNEPKETSDDGQLWLAGDYLPQQRVLGRSSVAASGSGRDLRVVIETEIIPRLMLVHRNGIVKGDDRDTRRPPIEPIVIAKFSKLVLNAQLDELVAFVKGLSDEGYSLRAVLLDLCAPVARWLGDQWVTDDLDFVAVTLGLSRLQQLVREIISAYDTNPDESRNARALIVPTPGEQHAFGAVLAAQLFRESGWIVDGGLAISMNEFKDLLLRESYLIVGFSHAADTLVDNLIAAIRLVRETLRPRPPAIIVGGRLAAERPDLCSVVGADLFAKHTSEAVEFGDRLMRQLSHASL